MGPVFWLSMRQLTGRWRLALILLLSALPVALAAIVHFAAADEDHFSDNFLDILLDGLLVAGILIAGTLGWNARWVRCSGYQCDS